MTKANHPRPSWGFSGYITVLPEDQKQKPQRGSFLSPIEQGLMEKLDRANMKGNSGDRLLVSQICRAFTITDDGRRCIARLLNRYRSQYKLSAEEKEWIRCHAT